MPPIAFVYKQKYRMKCRPATTTCTNKAITYNIWYTSVAKIITQWLSDKKTREL